MFRPLVLALSLSILGGLAAETAAADPPRILGSHIRDQGDHDRGRHHDGDRDRDRDRDRDDRRHDRDRDGRQHARDDDRHRDRWRDDDRRHDYRHDRRDDRRHDRRHDRRYDNDRYSFGLYLGSPWLGAPYYHDDYPRYRDDCRIVYRTRYDRWGRAYRERVRECYDRGRGRYW